MSAACGVVMIALNCGQALRAHQWQRAGFDAVAPALLIGWGFLGPWLLRKLADARAALEPVAVPDAATMARARRTAAETAPRTRTTKTAHTPRTALQDAPQTGAGTPVQDAPPVPAPAPQPAPPRTSNGSAPRTADTAALKRTPDTDSQNPVDARAAILLDLMLKHGRDNVTWAMAGDALGGIDKSNGGRALTKLRNRADFDQLLARRERERRDQGADESELEAVSA